MNKISELKKLLYDSVEKELKKFKKMTPETIKQEVMTVLKEVEEFKNTDLKDNIYVEINGTDNNIIDVYFFGKIGDLIRNKLREAELYE